MVQFTDAEVAAKFEALVEKDRMVEQPGTYSGMFSNITPAMAHMMVRKECTHMIKLKDKIEKPQLTVKGAKPVGTEGQTDTEKGK